MITKQTKAELINTITSLKSRLQSTRSKLGVVRRKNRKLQSEKAALLLKLERAEDQDPTDYGPPMRTYTCECVGC